MAEQLKNMFFTQESIQKMAETVKHFYSDFDIESFSSLVFDSEFKQLELKQKMRHVAICLQKTLPGSYEQALDILKKTAPFISGFDAMSLPDFVELHGIDDWELSMDALETFTKYSSSEFAIRPFLANDLKKGMDQMNLWADSQDEKIRRFASEGCRPRLPWAMALPELKKDPSLIFPILEKLKSDPSESVRRSVANNLNDISKDNPEKMLSVCEQWIGNSEKIDWIVKHASRTLLKAGNKRALKLFGYCDPGIVSVENLQFEKESVLIGEDANYSFELVINSNDVSKVRIEYAVYFIKSSGKPSKKVFKIAEGDYKPGKLSYNRKHSFKNMSTRKHFPGPHRIVILVNGEEKQEATVNLNNP